MNTQNAVIIPPYDVPVTDGVDGPQIGYATNICKDDKGNVVADVHIDKDNPADVLAHFDRHIEKLIVGPRIS